jgi:hypothetical protein
MARSEERERMAALLKQWRMSGESGAAFCRRHGIEPRKLSYWKRVLARSTPARRRSRGRAASGLVPIHLLGGVGAVSGTALEIHLSGGDRIVFPSGGSLAVLREVVELLRERC